MDQVLFSNRFERAIMSFGTGTQSILLALVIFAAANAQANDSAEQRIASRVMAMVLGSHLRENPKLKALMNFSDGGPADGISTLKLQHCRDLANDEVTRLNDAIFTSKRRQDGSLPPEDQANWDWIRNRIRRVTNTEERTRVTRYLKDAAEQEAAQYSKSGTELLKKNPRQWEENNNHIKRLRLRAAIILRYGGEAHLPAYLRREINADESISLAGGRSQGLGYERIPNPIFESPRSSRGSSGGF